MVPTGSNQLAGVRWTTSHGQPTTPALLPLTRNLRGQFWMLEKKSISVLLTTWKRRFLSNFWQRWCDSALLYISAWRPDRQMAKKKTFAQQKDLDFSGASREIILLDRDNKLNFQIPQPSFQKGLLLRKWERQHCRNVVETLPLSRVWTTQQDVLSESGGALQNTRQQLRKSTSKHKESCHVHCCRQKNLAHFLLILLEK